MRPIRLTLVAFCLLTVAAAPEPTAPEPQPNAVEQVPPDQAVAILGRTVATPDGHIIGRLVDVLVDSAGMPLAAVIDFGGFMGVGARKIAVHWSTLQFTPSNAKQPIALALTPDQIKAVPEYRDTTKAAPVVVPNPPSPAQPPPTETP
jgi:PRC-barrel domain